MAIERLVSRKLKLSLFFGSVWPPGGPKGPQRAWIFENVVLGVWTLRMVELADSQQKLRCALRAKSTRFEV
jgi:hypothetical protein